MYKVFLIQYKNTNEKWSWHEVTTNVNESTQTLIKQNQQQQQLK